MTDNSEQPNVRISAPRQSTGSDEDSYLRSGPLIHTPEYTVVVPVTGTLLDTNRGINVKRFLQTAIALAAENDGRVLLLGVETVENDVSLETVREYIQTEQPTDSDTRDAIKTLEERQTQLAQIAAVAREIDPGVSVSAVVRAVTDATEGILDVLGGASEMAVLLLRGTELDEGRLLTRSTIDAILADAECDVFVENLGTHGGANALYVPDVEEHTVASLAESEAETIDSILLPVGMGAHAALATEAARAIARAYSASVTILHVISPEASAQERAEANDLLRFAEYVLGPEVSVETEIREASDIGNEIVQEAQTHNLTSIGYAEDKSRLKQFVFESVQETLSEQRGVTVLMARDSDRTMRSLYYRWKRGIEAMEDDS